MSILDIFKGNKKENAIQINAVGQQQTFMPWVWSFQKGDKPLGNFFLQAILNMLWQGISNVTFKQSGKEMITPATICEFIDKNAVLLMNSYISNGYIAVFYDKKENYRIPNQNELKFNTYGEIINKYCIVIYSPQYQTNAGSLMKIALPVIGSINKMAGSQDYLTETLGCLSILSGQDLPQNPAQKENFLKNFNQTYGIGQDKFQFLLTNRDIKYIPIRPDLKGLEFEEKIKQAFKYLANLFGIPLPLLFDESSTYNNVKEAKTFFYDTTVRFYAEILLKVARELLTASADFIPQSAITYKIENVPELEVTLSAACGERQALLNYLISLKNAGADVTKQIDELVEDSKKLFKNV